MRGGSGSSLLLSLLVLRLLLLPAVRRLILGLDRLEAFAQASGERPQLAELVAQPAQLLGDRRAILEVAHDFLAAPAQPPVELVIDHAAERTDRGGVTDDRERFDRGGLAETVSVSDPQRVACACFTRHSID